MSFSITIDFDLTPEDLALLKAIGERAKKIADTDENINRADKERAASYRFPSAVKELLREALKATTPKTTAHNEAVEQHLHWLFMEEVKRGIPYYDAEKKINSIRNRLKSQPALFATGTEDEGEVE